MRTLNSIVMLIVFIFIALAFSCSIKTLPTSQVNFLNGSDGTITMRAIGIGKNQEDAIIDAEQNSFNVIFFRGLQESEQKIALIGSNETEIKENHKKYFDMFYNKKRYKTFLMSSVPASDIIIYKGGEKSIAVDIKINLVALRKDLEQSNIIRKFGF